ncbi:unnamed protein product [Lactuca virosa]|uniref:Uncharacterized protein n=1 Tax=Lactuca virosa TaxID=75947 RepID=A0AAU9PM51_9ASTR|nr:unnamed protein product [Lactuca virosa]
MLVATSLKNVEIIDNNSTNAKGLRFYDSTICYLLSYLNFIVKLLLPLKRVPHVPLFLKFQSPYPKDILRVLFRHWLIGVIKSVNFNPHIIQGGFEKIPRS